MQQQGLVHIYCGDGKGKTTAAIGLGVRACGSGIPVLLVQFLKDGNSSEISILHTLTGFSISPFLKDVTFTFHMTPEQKKEAAEFYTSVFQSTFEKVSHEPYGLLILDELINCVNAGLIEEALVVDAIKNRPSRLELVLTGRNPSPALLEVADYITEMKKVRHPYDNGLKARCGIEY